MEPHAPNTGIGVACGTDKGGYVAACAEVSIDPTKRVIEVRYVCQAFECGAICNPSDRKSTRLNSSHLGISYAVFCLKKKRAPEDVSGELRKLAIRVCKRKFQRYMRRTRRQGGRQRWGTLMQKHVSKSCDCVQSYDG